MRELPREVELAYVGTVVPDEAEYRNEAFSRAGNMFQTHLITGLQADGLTPSLVLCVRPVAGFPKSKVLGLRSSRAVLACGIWVSLTPCLNITPIKQLIVGMVTLCRLLRWGWKCRHTATRVVYTYNLTMPPAIFTLVAARLIGARAIASINDINEPGETVPVTRAWELDFWLHKRLIPKFDGLVVVSSAIIKDFAPNAPHIRIEGGVVPEMISKPRVHQDSRRANLFCVGFAGGLDAANGVREMLQAIALLKGEHYRFLVAGDGPLAEEVRRAAACDSRIAFRGFLALADVLSLYGDADVLVNMRLTKAIQTRYFFPSKMFELLASGTPVISTCTGHVESEFGEFVFLLKNETPEGLVEAIQIAEKTDENTRNDMGSRARKFILENKTWSIQTARIAKFIRDVAPNTKVRNSKRPASMLGYKSNG